MTTPRDPHAAHAAAWRALEAHHRHVADQHLRDLLEGDDGRFERYAFELEDLLVDFSKHRVTDDTMRHLFDLARAAEVEEARAAMFAGEPINRTEDRAVFHVALRHRGSEPMRLATGEDVMPAVRAVLDQMRAFTAAVHEGTFRGFTGERITDVVNIGIGGSHLGPQMAVRALAPYHRAGIRVHFVSNVDGAELFSTLARLVPERTLFLVASKTFTTQETMTNAHTARTWLLDALGDEAAVAHHFVALSTHEDKVRAFGIDPANMFAFWDWVGGRYSLWSAIGLSIALAIGFARFEELLDGAYLTDRHFVEAPLERNVPVWMALLGVWYTNFFGAETHAILPYDASLEYLPSFLQQADMESNGKSVTRAGEAVRWQTGPVVWGQVGTNGQHAFFQLLHQGTKLVPADFLAAATPQHPLDRHHAILLANFVAQTEALAMGRTSDETRSGLREAGVPDDELALLTAAKSFPGNRPSTSIVFDQLTPRALGSLIALYEHKIFVQGVIWDVNSFDQMGVELGKELAGHVLGELRDGRRGGGAHDPSTAALIARLKRARR
ncbi:MAG: glucose-6-phosphate isomerase [Trueperaceae bacterium]